MGVIFLVGHRGSGKNYLANKIKQRHNVIQIDTGPLIRKFYNENFLEVDFKSWLKFGEQKYGKDFTNIVVCKQIEINYGFNFDIENAIILIIGNRSMEGIEYIINHFKIKDSKIVFLDGPIERIRENYNLRENKNLSIEEFEKIVQLEKSMGIDGVKEYVKTNKNGYYFYSKKNSEFNIEEYERILGIYNKYIKEKGDREI